MSRTQPSDGRCYLPTYDNCFVCGRRHPRGLRLRFYTQGDGIAQVEFTPDDTLTGYEEVVHGGVIAAVFDELLGWSVGLKTEHLFLTGELTIRYLRPIRSNRTYLGAGQAVQEKKRYWVATGELKDEEGTICARARGKYFPVGEEKTREFASRMSYQPEDLPIFLDERVDAAHDRDYNTELGTT